MFLNKEINFMMYYSVEKKTLSPSPKQDNLQ